jgi:hypothetical protein
MTNGESNAPAARTILCPSSIRSIYATSSSLPLPSLAPPAPTPETLRPTTERCPSSHAQSYIRLHLKCEEAWAMGRWDRRRAPNGATNSVPV